MISPFVIHFPAVYSEVSAFAGSLSRKVSALDRKFRGLRIPESFLDSQLAVSVLTFKQGK